MRACARTLACASLVAAVSGASSSARAAGGTPCALAPGFRLALEERGILDRGSGSVVAVAPSPSGLVSGDVIRQANGVGVAGCADIERAAAEAAAKGLVLLLAVERQGQVFAIAATTPAIDTRLAAQALTAGPPRALAAPPAGPAAPAAVVAGAPAAPAAVAAAPVAAAPAPAAPAAPAPVAPAPAPPVPVAAPSPRPRRVTTLPPRGEASADLRRRAGAAATALARVDDAARAGVPINVYERRLGDAEATIATLEFGVNAVDSEVRDFVEETITLYRTGRDIRRAQLLLLSQSGVDRRASAASTLPYFSDSKVPEWVSAYPFLQETILEPPHETRLPIPGEVAGRWNPDRALELLWERARTATSALANWSEAS